MNNNPKFICTAGPSIFSKDVLRKLYMQGMFCLRLNMSYRLDYYDEIVKIIKELNDEENCDIKLMCDLAGPELRVILDNTIDVKKGQLLILDKDIKIDRVNIQLLKIGDEFNVRDGLIILKVNDINNDVVTLISENDGQIYPNCNCFHQNTYNNLEFLCEKDILNINDAIRYSADYIAVSHIRSIDDLGEIKNSIKGHDIKIISKIENEMAMNLLDEIIDYSDGIMIARGDLGKILPIEDLGYNQKIITERTLLAKKELMSATDYLPSLTNDNLLTRPEVLDLFNSYNDGINIIIFTKEVAISKDPVNVLIEANKIFNSYLKYRDKRMVNDDK